MSDAMKLVGDIEKKVNGNPMPLMMVLDPAQVSLALSVFAAAKNNSVDLVDKTAKALATSMQPFQRLRLVAILGEDIVTRLEALR